MHTRSDGIGVDNARGIMSQEQSCRGTVLTSTPSIGLAIHIGKWAKPLVPETA